MLISYYANKKSSPRLPSWQPSLIFFNIPIESGSIIKPCTLKHFQVTYRLHKTGYWTDNKMHCHFHQICHFGWNLVTIMNIDRVVLFQVPTNDADYLHSVAIVSHMIVSVLDIPFSKMYSENRLEVPEACWPRSVAGVLQESQPIYPAELITERYSSHWMQAPFSWFQQYLDQYFWKWNTIHQQSLHPVKYASNSISHWCTFLLFQVYLDFP